MEATTPSVGQVLGHYRIIEQVGAGGMGVVFRARDEQLDRDVALKILPRVALLTESSRRQFRREALSLARITDPNVTAAFDFGCDDGFDYLVTEYVPGLTLDSKLGGLPLSEAEVLNLGKQLASGLEAAHREGVIHRDLKPSNLRVTPDGRVKILDFGLAFLLQPNAETDVTASLTSRYSDAGTLPYMAPEQIKDLISDARSDVWSAGAVLYEMSTGKRPFADLAGAQLVAAILEQEPLSPRALNPKISEGLERVILRAMQKDPKERYQSAGDLRIDLANLATGTSPIQAPRKTSPSRTPWFVTVAILVLLAGGWWIFGRGARPATASRMLAVLPFESVANDAPTNALGLGLTETVTTKLVQASEDRHLQLVATRELVAQGVKTADQARREFGTDLVLEGSLQQSGDQIRITCSLVDPKTHVQLAAKEVTGDVSQIFELQDRLFEQVQDMLPLAVESYHQPALKVRPDTQPAAYDFYLRGRGYLEEYQDLDNIKNAITQFERAVDVDPKYAAAHAAMGMAYATGFRKKNQGKYWLENARAHCEQALTINSQLAEGHTCLGSVYFSTGRYDDAVKEFERSLDLDHLSDETLALLAAAYQKTGRAADAEGVYRKVISLRPNYWGLYVAFGGFYYNQARYADAAEQYRKATQLAPLNYLTHSNLGAIYLLLGRYPEAVDVLRQSIALRPSLEAYGNLGAAYFYMGRYEDSAENLQQALKIDQIDWLNSGNLGDTLYQIPTRRQEALSAYRNAIKLARLRLESNPKDASTLAFTADYYAMLDQEQQAREQMAKALEIAPGDADVLFRAAIVYNHFGDTEKTLDYLSRSISAGYSRTVIRDTPDFNHLKNDPRFRALLPKS